MLETRGPDDSGWLVWNKTHGCITGSEKENPEGSVFFGHRRLSIIDLSNLGHQPMSNSNGRFHITYNGEVYNYRELREELKAKGYAFKTQTDTEVVLYAYIHWGREALNKIRGMFAFAILDVVENSIFLARDHFGIKPLYYCQTKSELLFSSEINPILSYLGRVPKLASNKVYEYLAFGVADTDGETMYEGINQLDPASLMHVSVTDLSLSIHKYWDLDVSNTLEISFTEAVERVRELFLESIALHMRSDVPVGSALSGGIDSSAIVCAINHLYPDSEQHVFSYIANDDAISEEYWVDLVCKHTGAIQHKVGSDMDTFISDLPALVLRQDVPFAGTSIYAQYCVFRAASEAGIKVMLDGQGADELLAGYTGYHGAKLAEMLTHLNLFGSVNYIGSVGRRQGKSASFLIQRALQYFTPGFLSSIAYRLVGRDLTPAWIKQQWLHDNAIQAVAVSEVNGLGNLLKKELYRSVRYRGLPSLLRHEDRNSMAHSIESRVPFLMPEFAQYLMSLPSHYLLSDDGVSKSVFREAMRGIVPDEILDRKDKVGFQTPEPAWLKQASSFVTSILDDSVASEVIDTNIARKEWGDIISGQTEYDAKVWRWINFLEWQKQNKMLYA